MIETLAGSGTGEADALTASDLLATARQQGIRSLSDVELAVLEADGKVSFFTATGSSEGAPETGVSS